MKKRDKNKKKNRFFRIFNYTDMSQYRKAIRINRNMMVTSLLWFIPLLLPVPESLIYVFATIGVFQAIIASLVYTNISSKNRYVFEKIRAATNELKGYGITTKAWQVYAVDNLDHDHQGAFKMEIVFYPAATEAGALWNLYRKKKVYLPMNDNDIKDLKKYLKLLQQNIQDSDKPVILYATLDPDLATVIEDAGIDLYPAEKKYLNKPSKLEFYSAYGQRNEVKELYKDLAPYYIGWLPMGD